MVDRFRRQAAGVLAAVVACRTSSSAPGYPLLPFVSRTAETSRTIAPRGGPAAAGRRGYCQTALSPAVPSGPVVSHAVGRFSGWRDWGCAALAGPSRGAAIPVLAHAGQEGRVGLLQPGGSRGGEDDQNELWGLTVQSCRL
jgi:hypothetical protein